MSDSFNFNGEDDPLDAWWDEAELSCSCCGDFDFDWEDDDE